MYRIYADDVLIHSSDSEEYSRIVLSPSETSEIGKADSLQFSLPSSNVYYFDITPYATKIVVMMDEQEVFRGRVLDITRDFDNIKTVTCESDMAYLLDSVIKNEDYTGTTRDFFRVVIEKHNASVREEYKQFVVGEITIDNRELRVLGQSDKEKRDDGTLDMQQITINGTTNERKTAYDYIESYIISYVGGYLRVRRVNGKNVIDLLKDNFGHTASQMLEFGNNVIDISQEFKASELFTVLIPLGDDNLTIESVNDGSEELVDEAMVAKYGRIVKTNVFSNVRDPAKLLQNGQAYMQRHCKIPKTITIKAVDLHHVDSTVEGFNVGDIVHVKSEVHELDEDILCTRITRDLADPSNDEYQFGDPEQTLTDIFLEDKQKGGGGGSKKKDEVVDQTIKDYFYAYMGYSEESGTVDLTAEWKKVDEAMKEVGKLKYVLHHQLGVNLDAEEGRIDLVNLRETLDSVSRKQDASASAIHVLQGDLASMQTQIEMTSSSTKYNGSQIQQHFAQYLQETSATKASIDMVVGNTRDNATGIHLVSEKVDGQEQSITTINTDITRIKSRVTEVENLIAKAITTDSLTTNGLSNLRLLSVTGTSTFGNRAGFYNGLSVYGGSSSFNGDVSIMQPYTLKIRGKEVATQQWVADQGFATQQWVTDQKYLKTVNWNTNITNKPTMIEKWVMVDGVKIWYWASR